MGNWIPGDPTLVAQILRISSSYSPPPPDGFVSPMTWGVEDNVVERFTAAGVPEERISFQRDTYTFNYPAAPSELLASFRTYYGPTMNAFEAAAADGREAELQAELDALFNEQNTSADATSIPATFLQVTSMRAATARNASCGGLSSSGEPPVDRRCGPCGVAMLFRLAVVRPGGRLDRIIRNELGGRAVRGLTGKAIAIGTAPLAILALTTATVVVMPARAAAAPGTIPPSEIIEGRLVHSGEGARRTAALAVPLRVADAAAYAREKQRAEQVAGASPPLSAGVPGSTSGAAASPAPATAVFGSLNAAGLSASQEIAAFGEGNDLTPPDTTGAIGPEQYVEFVNSEVAAYNRSNLAIVGSPVDLSTFIGGVAACDPQIKYDPKSSRWFYAAIRCDGTRRENALYLGFSKTSNPSDFSTAAGHGWCGYAYSTGSVFEDYPKLGLDSTHMMVGSNGFSAQTGAFITAHISSLPKPASGNIETCPGAPKLTRFGSETAPLRTSVENHIAFTPEPATVADESTSGFVVAADEATPGSGSGSHVMIWQLAGSGEEPELKSLGAAAVTAFKLPPNVPQPGTSDKLDSLDARLTQAVAAADPSAGGAEAVWTQHTVAGGAGSVVSWYELLPGNLEVRQAGTISDPSLFAFNGAIAPTLSGGAVINYNTGSASALVQIMAQSRVSSDPVGTTNTPIALASSAAVDSDFSCPSFEPKSTACRWGDYAGASVDPTNANVVWGSNQVNGPADTGHRAQWATQDFALTPSSPPTVVTAPASAITRTSATLNATVNPDGSAVSECRFEYGTTTSYGSTAPCTPSPGSGTSPVAVSAAISGLTANTTYHFRISATNAARTSTGADQPFKTLPFPPEVVTEPASAVAQTSATANATVNPKGGEGTECRFEYGTSTEYGRSAPCTSAPGSGESPVAVSGAFESLAENTTYHFRVVATNAGGESFGSDQSFTTTLVLSPHWTKNGVTLEEGSLSDANSSGLDILAWGVLTLENANTGLLACETLAGGDIANPTGGGAGKGAIDAFAFYDCYGEKCEVAGGKLEVVPERLEWTSVLVEEAGVFRDKLEGIGLRATCSSGGSVELHGTLKPRFKAGTLIGSAPSKLEFDASSGSLQGAQGSGAVTGTLKVVGFEAEELLRPR